MHEADHGRTGRGLQGLACALALAACAGCDKKREDLTTEQLNAVVAREQPALKRCYDAALISHPYTQEMQLEAEIHIRKTGEVASVKLNGGGGLPGMGPCLMATIKAWRFPAAKDPTDTSLPLVFHPEVKRAGPNFEQFKEALRRAQ